MAYDPELWHDLFVMIGGASAALAGLIFVAVSLNHEQILQAKSLPNLALQTLSLLIGLVLLCAVGLAPGQPQWAFGLEVLALSTILFAILIGTTIRTLSEAEKLSWRASRVVLGLVASLSGLVAGISILVGAGGGLYWLLLQFLVGLVVATYYAWVLLIEIRR